MSLWDVMVSIFWFMMLFAWIWLLIAILGDIFGDRTLSGWGKAMWTFFLIVLPWLGALSYLIARGSSMNERALAKAQERDEQFRQYVKESAGPAQVSVADEMAKLADLRDRGVISQGDYELASRKVLGQTTGPSRTVTTA
jgi:hypothetical protein